jgi:hypothetical protein
MDMVLEHGSMVLEQGSNNRNPQDRWQEKKYFRCLGTFMGTR